MNETEALAWMGEGRRTFVAMLKATIDGDVLIAARVTHTLDRNEMLAVLSVALGTAASCVEQAAELSGTPVAEYMERLEMLAAQS